VNEQFTLNPLNCHIMVNTKTGVGYQFTVSDNRTFVRVKNIGDKVNRFNIADEKVVTVKEARVIWEYLAHTPSWSVVNA